MITQEQAQHLRCCIVELVCAEMAFDEAMRGRNLDECRGASDRLVAARTALDECIGSLTEPEVKEQAS